MLLGLFFIGPVKVLAVKLDNNNYYRSIVKIYTYYLDKNNNFIIAKTGFGVIINEDGSTLTNEHTVTVKDSFGMESPVAFKICLIKEDPYKEPICNYTADLLGKDDKTDLALLKLKFPDSNYAYSFDYVNLYSRQASKDQRVYAYGYPASAGDTIFGLVGAVSGTIVKNGFLMIQNSPLPLFGSAGGALFNDNGDLLGITSDISKGTGDVLSVDSINSFKDKYSVTNLTDPAVQKKFNVFLNKLIDAKAKRKFVNEIPHLELSWGTDQLFIADTLQNISVYNQVEIPASVVLSHWVPDFIKQFQHSVLIDQVNNFRNKLLSLVSSNFEEPKADIQEFNSLEFNKMILDHLSAFKDSGSPYRTVIKNKEISIVSPVNNDGWFFNLSWVPVGTAVNEDFLSSIIGKITSDSSCSKQGSVSIAGKTGRKISCQVSGTEFKVILVGSDNFLISVIYSYGKGGVNKGNGVVDLLIKNVIISDQPSNSQSQSISQVKTVQITKSDVKTDQSDKQTAVQSAAGQIQPIKNIGEQFIGRILLRVQNNGEAWYLSPKTNQAHYLANGQAAYQLMRDQGLGITNKDLSKIPVGLSNLTGADSDNDGLTDALEGALGTDPNKADSDNDGFNDKDEIQRGFNPLQKGALSLSSIAFTNRFRGQILLQVESHGEAWYINPKDGKRYFLGTADDAYQVMKQQSLGITEKDFAKL
ncbi:MAG: trypsin-like peptidase domain-containing protein [Candidatus Komeilibacteria bacterium]|nr:trypsin-like peptidase domain-containing protein [Candidatus Komeilibacteria bacterium]